jgi:hypothetical protein
MIPVSPVKLIARFSQIVIVEDALRAPHDEASLEPPLPSAYFNLLELSRGM